MKKFLIALLCALSVNVSYAGGPDDDLFQEVDSVAAEFFAGRVDLETAQELCKKVFQYAYAHNIEIWLEKEQGGLRLVDKHICETNKYGEDAIQAAVFFAFSAANWIKNQKIEAHSNAVQTSMELAAESNCARNSSLEGLRRQGYETYSAKSVVKCSQTDKRCLVSIPVKKDGQTSLYTACCMVEPAEVKTSAVSRNETRYDGEVGSVSVFWDGITSNTPNLDDFGYDCKPLDK